MNYWQRRPESLREDLLLWCVRPEQPSLLQHRLVRDHTLASMHQFTSDYHEYKDSDLEDNEALRCRIQYTKLVLIE